MKNEYSLYSKDVVEPVNVFEEIKNLRDSIVKSERALLLNAKLLDNLVNILPEIIYVTNINLILTHANKACLDFLNIDSLDKIKGKTCTEVFECVKTNYSGSGQCCVRSIIDDRPVGSYVKREVFCDAIDKWFEVNVYFINSDVQSYVHIIRDITVSKKDAIAVNINKEV